MKSIYNVFLKKYTTRRPTNWRLTRLKEIIPYSQGGIWGNEAQGNDNDIVCYRMADFDFPNLRLKFDSLTFRSIDKEQRDSRSLREGDLLLEKSGGGDKMPVGRVVYVNSGQPAVCSNFIQALRPTKAASSLSA